GVHGGAADHRVLGIGNGAKRGKGNGASEQSGSEFTHGVKLLEFRFPASLGRKEIRSKIRGVSKKPEKNRRRQMFFKSPAATTGPVGWPVGEPPAGSRLTASTAPCASFSLAAAGTDICAVAPAGMTPIDTGRFLPSIIHSSKSLPAARLPATCERSMACRAAS